MPTTERRHERRQIAYLDAEVTYNQQCSGMDCLVRDIAPSGALIVFADGTLLPGELELHVPQQGRSFRGTVVWRHFDRAGLALLPLKRRALKKENPALRHRYDSPI